MAASQWRVRPGQLETCRACGLSFTMILGESLSSLVHRYTDWREAHASCQPPEAAAPEAAPDA